MIRNAWHISGGTGWCVRWEGEVGKDISLQLLYRCLSLSLSLVYEGVVDVLLAHKEVGVLAKVCVCVCMCVCARARACVFEILKLPSAASCGPRGCSKHPEGRGTLLRCRYF